MTTSPDFAVPADMNHIAIRTPGGPEVLTLARAPVPVPGRGDLLIRVAAAGVNAPDLQQRRGRYDPPPGASPILGLEVGGVVVARSEGATRFAVGDEVVALCNGGGYADYVVVPETQALPVPKGWTLIEAAALPETFFTVQQTLVLRAGLTAGMNVLIHGAAGGIGGAAIAISRHYGARPIAVVSTEAKAEYARAMGAAEIILRTKKEFASRTRELTEGRGADRIVDIVGGGTMAGNLDAAAVEGIIVQLATLSGSTAEINAGLIVSKRLSILGSTLRPQPRAVKGRIAASLLSDIWPGLASGHIARPRVQVMRLGEAGAAHAAMETPGHYGKIVLVTPFGDRPAG